MIQLRDIQIVIAVAYGTIDVLFRVLIMSYINGTAYFGVNRWMYLLSVLLSGTPFNNHLTLGIYKTLFVVP